MKFTKRLFFAVLSTIALQTTLGINSSIAAMDSKDWADAFEILGDVLGGASNSSNQNSSTGSASSYSSERGSFRWPSRGGLEDWGFQRPSGCQSDDFYEVPLAEKMNKYSNWGSIEDIKPAKKNEYTSGRTGQMIRQAKGNPQAVAALQADLDKIEAELKQLDADGISYIQLTSTGLQPNIEGGAKVIKAIKQFEIVGVDCGNMQGAANSIACGLQAKAFQITANLERFVQIACHLGLNTPSYQVANVNANPSLPSPNSSASSQTGSNKQQESSSKVDSNAGGSQSPSQQVANYASQNLSSYDSKYQGKGKKHNADAEASRCLRFDPKRKQIFNDCDYRVEALFCAINPDPNSIHAFEMAPYFNCDSNSIGMWPVSAKTAMVGKFTADNVAVFACKKPSIPGAKFNRDSKSFSGRCSEY